MLPTMLPKSFATFKKQAPWVRKFCDGIMGKCVFISAVRKYHVYRDVWKPLTEEKLVAEQGAC